MSRMTERGVDYVAHDGMWDDGVPIINKDEENEASWSWQQMRAAAYASMSDDDDEYDEYYRSYNDSPRCGDYDHNEEAS